jgi:amidase
VWGISYTAVFNLTGNPVVAMPFGQTKEGLPIGVQVVGRRWRDMELLSVAQKLTEVTGVCQRPPGY